MSELVFHEIGVRQWKSGHRILSQASEESIYQMWGPYRKRMRNLGSFTTLEEAEKFLNQLPVVLREDEIPDAS